MQSVAALPDERRSQQRSGAPSPETLRSRYDRLDDVKNVLATYDPEGKFRNEYIHYYLYGSEEVRLEEIR